MGYLYVLLGGNLGERHENLKKATDMLAQKVGTIELKSPIYETAAWGKKDQPNFLNQALKIKTFKTNPAEILEDILQIEVDLGRKRIEHWGARVIDIDILLLGEIVIQSQRLTIPHPELQNRRFVLIPLKDIAAEVVHPVYQKSIANLLDECKDDLEVKRVD